jgi:hypothetical protein
MKLRTAMLVLPCAVACAKSSTGDARGAESESESGSDDDTETGCALTWEPDPAAECQGIGGPLGPPEDSGDFQPELQAAIAVDSEDTVHVLVPATALLNSGQLIGSLTHHVFRDNAWDAPVVSDGRTRDLRVTVTGAGEFLATDSRAIGWSDTSAFLIHDSDDAVIAVAGQPSGSGAWLLRRDAPEPGGLSLLAFDGVDCVTRNWTQLGCDHDTWIDQIQLAADPEGEPVVARIVSDQLVISSPTRTPNTFTVAGPVSPYLLGDFEIDQTGRMHVCYASQDLTDPIVYATGDDAGPWQMTELEWGPGPNICRLAVSPDGTSAWLVNNDAWFEGAWIAHVVEGAVQSTVIDDDDLATSIDVDIDSSGRPWVIIYRIDPNLGGGSIDIAHQLDSDWSIETLQVP